MEPRPVTILLAGKGCGKSILNSDSVPDNVRIVTTTEQTHAASMPTSLPNPFAQPKQKMFTTNTLLANLTTDTLLNTRSTKTTADHLEIDRALVEFEAISRRRSFKK